MTSNITDQHIRIRLEDLERMYSLLVWLGELKPEQYIDPIILEKIAYIAELYPENAKNLLLPEKHQFYFGFYSGNLANIRYVLSMKYEGIEAADADFPDLEAYA